MDTTILNLLFNYKGAITSREFRIGITLVIMSMVISLVVCLDASFLNVIAGKGSVEWFSEILLYNQIANYFVPNLVPTSFLLSYSSFILAVKRIRMLTNNRTLAVISGVLSFLFFSSYMALMMLVMQMGSGSSIQDHTFALPLLLGVIFLIGGVNLVFLCLRTPSEPSILSCPKGQLDISGYAIKLGKLMGVAVVLVILITVAFPHFWALLLFYPIISTVLAVCALVILYFYLRYSALRLKDAGISVLWLVAIVAVYLALFGLKIWLNMYFINYLTLYYNTLFSIASSFLGLLQCALFILPTKRVNCGY